MQSKALHYGVILRLCEKDCQEKLTKEVHSGLRQGLRAAIRRQHDRVAQMARAEESQVLKVAGSSPAAINFIREAGTGSRF